MRLAYLAGLVTTCVFAGTALESIFTDGFEDPSSLPPDFPQPTAVQEPSIDDRDADAASRYPGNGSVQINSGEKRLGRVDLVVPGRGHIHFTFARQYRSRLDYDGPLGFGWDFTHNLNNVILFRYFRHPKLNGFLIFIY